LEREIVLFGLVTLFVTGIYLLFVFLIKKQRVRVLQKEFVVAIIYTIGIWGGPITLIDLQLNPFQVICLMLFFLLAFADLLIFSIHEYQEDKTDRHNTFPVNFGKKTAHVVTYIILILVVLFAWFLIISDTNFIYNLSGSLFIFMSLILFVLLVFKSFFKKDYRYRFIGELVFWLPGIVFFTWF
jgi:4-hydroxybenzoate polyprenyltransferase